MTRNLPAVASMPNFSAVSTSHGPRSASSSICPRLVCVASLFLVAFLLHGTPGKAATNRSAYIGYGIASSPFAYQNMMALDTVHQQIFTAWTSLDRVDVISTVDYHLIRSITVPSPNTLDISPDGSTIAVANSVATIFFFSTATYAKTGEFVLPGMGLGIESLVYTGTGDLMLTASDSTTAGITTYWNHLTNSMQNYTNESNYTASGAYLVPSLIPAQLSRSSDYTRIIIGQLDLSNVQIVDGTTGIPLYNWDPEGAEFSVSAVAAGKGGNRYAICAGEVGYSPSLIILDSNFDPIYQGLFQNDIDSICIGMTFSADGNTLYGDISQPSGFYTQALDMNTFEAKNVPNYFTGQPPKNGSTLNGTATIWQAADVTGMVYGIYPSDELGQPVLVALDTVATGPLTPPSYQVPVQIVRVVDNIGSPQGGDSIDLLCTGLSQEPASSVQVSVGGKAATVV
jgi:hypothetical protein